MSKAAFIQHRNLAITEHRIKQVLWYVLECYSRLKNDRVVYSKSEVKVTSKINFENYLKFKFVKYLQQNKTVYQSKFSELESIEFNFHPELEKTYFDLSEIEQVDKIDIYINRLGLQQIWSDVEENVYLAIECKRIKNLSDVNNYLLDTQKFCQRRYGTRRLPFETQMAFVEKTEFTVPIIVDKINSDIRLQSIPTILYLTRDDIHETEKETYYSIHMKKFKPNERFRIYHLFLDYSLMVTD